MSEIKTESTYADNDLKRGDEVVLNPDGWMIYNHKTARKGWAAHDARQGEPVVVVIDQHPPRDLSDLPSLTFTGDDGDTEDDRRRKWHHLEDWFLEEQRHIEDVLAAYDLHETRTE